MICKIVMYDDMRDCNVRLALCLLVHVLSIDSSTFLYNNFNISRISYLRIEFLLFSYLNLFPSVSIRF